MYDADGPMLTLALLLLVALFVVGAGLGSSITDARWRATVAPLCEAHGGLVSPAQTVYLYPDACVEALTNG